MNLITRLLAGRKIDPGPEVTALYVRDKILWECRNCEGRMKTAYLNDGRCPLCNSAELMIVARTPNEMLWALSADKKVASDGN